MDSMEETIAILRGILEEDFGIKTDGDLLRALDMQRAIDLTPFCAEIKPHGRKKRYDKIRKKAEARQEESTSPNSHGCGCDSVYAVMR